MQNIRYEEVNYTCEDFVVLCDELDQYLNKAIGGEEYRNRGICRKGNRGLL